MSGYKTDQRHVHHRGRDFHFVSYEGRVDNPRRGEVACPPTWYLMSSGKRWAVGPQIPDQEPTELDDMLTRWLDENVFTVTEPVAAPPRPKRLRRAR